MIDHSGGGQERDWGEEDRKRNGRKRKEREEGEKVGQKEGKEERRERNIFLKGTSQKECE